jgi:hypothetical protein
MDLLDIMLHVFIPSQINNLLIIAQFFVNPKQLIPALFQKSMLNIFYNEALGVDPKIGSPNVYFSKF